MLLAPNSLQMKDSILKVEKYAHGGCTIIAWLCSSEHLSFTMPLYSNRVGSFEAGLLCISNNHIIYNSAANCWTCDALQY